MMKQGFGSRFRLCAWAEGLGRVAVIVLAGLMAGCGTLGGGLSQDTPPDVLRAKVQERALARWQAIIDGDVDRAYNDYVSPASKNTLTLAGFRDRTRGAGVTYRRIEPGTVECQGASCTVNLFLWYDHRQIRGMRTPVEETWILDNGQAWYVWRG